MQAPVCGCRGSEAQGRDSVTCSDGQSRILTSQSVSAVQRPKEFIPPAALLQATLTQLLQAEDGTAGNPDPGEGMGHAEADRGKGRTNLPRH